jgi:sugar O-acyltransferase (sialic acid O-acetyltransferase NeuD family)
VADLVIFGIGEGARLATRYFEEEGRHRILAYTVDGKHKTADSFEGRDVVAFEEVVDRFPPDAVQFFVALGYSRVNGLRADKYAEVKALGYVCASYVHPANIVPPETVIGENCLILANQSIDRDVVIGNNVTIWSGCHLGDRSRIADHAWLSSHVCLNGDVVVDERCFLASNCCISPNVRLADRSFIGANALISQHTKTGAVHVVPATPAQPMDSERFMTMLRM